MKNVILAFAFMLIGSFAFANTNNSLDIKKPIESSKRSVEKASVKATLEDLKNLTLSLNEQQLSTAEFLALADCTLKGKFTITFSDGSKYTWEGTLTIVGQSCAEFLKSMMQ